MSKFPTREQIFAAAKDAHGRKYLHTLRVLMEDQLRQSDEARVRFQESCDRARETIRDISEALGEVQA